jgi:P2 family phage contractile tail tube protein
VSTLLILEAANLFCGDHDPTKSKHLTLQELQLPNLQAQYQDHSPGGAPVSIEIETGINKLEPSFKLIGYDPDLLVQFGVSDTIRRNYTAYGVLTDRRTGAKIEIKSIMEGRLGKVETDAYKRGDLLAHSYAINEVTHYEVWIGGNEKVYWDFWTNVWRVDGVDQWARHNQILRVTG